MRSSRAPPWGTVSFLLLPKFPHIFPIMTFDPHLTKSMNFLQLYLHTRYVLNPIGFYSSEIVLSVFFLFCNLTWVNSNVPLATSNNNFVALDVIHALKYQL